MKIAVASDLHLEFADINLKNEEGADVLILAGDICIAAALHDHPASVHQLSLTDGQLEGRQALAYYSRDFFKRISFQFKHVIVIAGNHEFYNGKWLASIDHLRHEYGQFPNIHFLERDTKVIDDVVFVGGTLWTDCNKGDPMTLHALSDMMNDFRCIRHDGLGHIKLRAAHTIERFNMTLGYFKHVLSENKDKKCVVVQHHAPSTLSIHDAYKSAYLMNGGFYSDLSEFILDHPQIKLLAHGHMHNQSDYLIGDTRVVCNPRGYAGHESCAYDFKLKYLEI